MTITRTSPKALAAIGTCALLSLAWAAVGWTDVWARWNGDQMGDRGMAVAIDSQDAIITVGYYGHSTGIDGAVVKRNADGTEEWSFAPGETVEDVCVDEDDAVYLGGNRNNWGSSNPVRFVERRHADGTLDWRWTDESSGASPSGVHALCLDADGFVYAGGFYESRYQEGLHWAVWKLDPDGNRVRTFTFDRNGEVVDAVFGVAVDHEGGVIAAGMFFYGVDGNAHVRKWNADGSVAWDVPFGDPNNVIDNFNDVVVDERGDVYAVGISNTGGTSYLQFDGVVHKISKDGEVLWTKTLSAPGVSVSFGHVVLDQRGYPVIAGSRGTDTSVHGWLGVYDFHGGLLDQQLFYEGENLMWNGIDRRGDWYALAGFVDSGDSTGENVFTRVLDRDPIVDTGGPSIDQPPTVSAPLAAVGEELTFGVLVSDPDGDPLLYRWDFGDGVSGRGPAPTHAYDAPGDYMAHVTVTDGLGDAQAQVGVTVGGPLLDTKVKAKLNFRKTGKDKATYRCGIALPVGFDPEAKAVAFDLGGVARTFTLNRQGVGKNELGKAKLKFKKKKGYWRLDVTLKKGDYRAAWEDEGLTDETHTGGRRHIASRVELDGVRCAHVTEVRYWSKAGKWGRTK